MRANKNIRILLIAIVSIGILQITRWSWGAETYNTGRERDAVKRVIDRMERYYEQRRVTQFMSLFSWRKFPNLIPLQNAVENDFNMNRDIRLRRTSERLTVSKGMAVDQATWLKQYMPMLVSPHGGSRMKRVSGTVRIYLEKEGPGRSSIFRGTPSLGCRQMEKS